FGWGFQAEAMVHPADFNYPGNNLRLDRDAYFRAYQNNQELPMGPSYKPKDFSPLLPPGNDPSLDQFRDDSPVLTREIYDLDAPWLQGGEMAPQNETRRGRWDFKEFASITAQGRLTRVSPIQTFFVRYSAKQMDAPNGDNWQLDNQIAGDNKLDTYTGQAPPVSWDLT